MKALGYLQALIGVLVVAVVLVVLAQRILGRARRRGSTTGNALEVFDEVFSPARYNATVELREHEAQGPVTPAPDDEDDDQDDRDDEGPPRRRPRDGGAAPDGST